MNTVVLLQNLQGGFSLGVIYAVVAIGYNLTFGVLKIANLAYGALLTVGAFTALYAHASLGLPALAAATIGIATSTFVGLVVHAIAVLPLGQVESVESPRHVAVLVSTLGAATVLEHIILNVFGPYPRRFSIAEEVISGAGTNQTSFIAIGIGLVTLGMLAALLRWSAFGIRIRALAANRELAQASGIDVTLDQMLCVALSAALAGLSGILVASQYEFVSPQMGFLFGLKGLVALIVGRSMVGSALVGLGLGVSEAAASTYLSSGYRDLIVYTLLISALFLVGRNRRAEAV